ncbi:unnamed protein product [Ectocarpus sp. CCAP 1310/34]|nr:unnamed protein product [Ectocarpus sp. CCAP 1310/34]
MLNAHSGQEAAVEVRDDAVENLRAGPRDVAQVKKGVTAALDHFPWLQSIWGMGIDIPPTREMIMTSWKYLVDLLAAGRARKPTTRTASTFTLSRFEAWPDRIRTWINHESVQEVARTRQGDQGTHYLRCIINVVDECYGEGVKPISGQELYRVFMEEREKSNTVALTYLTEIHKISTARGKEWDFIVQHNHSPSSAGAIERDPILKDMVGEVDARNDPAAGAGLLFPTLAWYLSRDLPAEILRVITESSEVRRAWGKCCPSAVAHPPFEAQPEILDDIYKFVLQKFHSFRGVVAGSGTVTNEGLAVETVRKMTKPQLFELTKGTLVDHIKAAGGDAKVWRKKEFLVNALLSVAGGSSEDGEGGLVDHGSGNGPVNVAGDGGDGKISNVWVNRVSATGGEGLEWIDAVPLEEAVMSKLLQELAVEDGEDDASLGDFDEEFLARSIDFDEVFPSSPKSNLADAQGPTRVELSFDQSDVAGETAASGMGETKG